MATNVRAGLATATFLYFLLALSACSGSADEREAGGGSGDGDGYGNAGEAGDGTSGSLNGTNGGTNDNPTFEPGKGGGGETTFNGSFIWIANSGQGTVSKIDTRSMVELGRYWTSPGKNGHPSRTSVGSTGAVVVANRGGGTDFGANPAGVVKIEASEDYCTDRDGNGVIDTSTGANDIRGWMEDECMSWWRPLDFFSNRPVTWAPPAGPDLPETVWTAGTTNCLAADCSFSALRLNGETGVIEERIEFAGLSGSSFITSLTGGFGGLPIPGLGGGFDMGDSIIGNYGPYGGAADAGGNFWGFNSNTMHLFRVDAVTLEPRTWVIPMSNGYGITIAKGHIFLCGDLGITRFDPASGTFTENFGAIDTGFNGCMTDGADKIWVGGGADFGTAGLHSFDANTLQFIQSYPVGQVKGVSVDYDGMIWGVGGGSMSADNDKAWRLDPATGLSEVFMGLTQAYSYSDMTGFGLENSGPVIVPLE